MPSQSSPHSSLLAVLVSVTGALLCSPGSAASPATDPSLSDATLRPADVANSDIFGHSIAVSGDTLLSSARLDDDNGGDSGSTYVFVQSGTTWSEEAKLTAADGASGDQFGFSVAIDGDTAVVGAPYDDDNGTDSGSAYVFVRSGTTWTQQAKLTGGDAVAFDFVGESVSISGDTIAIGGEGHDAGGSFSGVVYVFTRSGTTWAQEAKLLASDADANSWFGFPVVLDGDTLLAAAAGHTHGVRTGAAYIFTRSGTLWTEQAELLPSDGATDDFFGWQAALDGDTAVISSILDDDNGTDSGSAYVFTRSGTTWTEQAKLVAATGAEAFDHFGTGVAVEGDTVIVGANFADVGPYGNNRGMAYLFRRSGTVWTEATMFSDLYVDRLDEFGWAAGISGDTLAVSAPLVGSNEGAVYTFSLSRLLTPAPLMTDKLLSSDGQTGDGSIIFGRTVSLSGTGDTLAVKGVGGSPVASGQTYVFTSTGSGWTQEAALAPPDRTSGWLGFGKCAVDGDTLIAGAPEVDAPPDLNVGSVLSFEREGGIWTLEQTLYVILPAVPGANFGHALDIQGDTAVISARNGNGAVPSTGVAWVYTRSGGAWSPLPFKLQASDGMAGDLFGVSVALDGDTIVVGDRSHSHTGGLGGAVFVYVRGPGTSWVEQAELVNPSGYAHFGYSVDVDGDTLVVGHKDEGIPSGNQSQGAAYVYVRSGTTWTQQARLEASDGMQNDFFGDSVALDGDRIVVGAKNGDGAAADSGAAYVYVRGGTDWTEVAKLSAFDGTTGDLLGSSNDLLDGSAVTLRGSTLIVGAPGEDAAYAFDISDPCSAFPSFCDASDGALASCPCGNPGTPDTGCDIQQGTGGVRLCVLAQQTLAQNRATVRGTGFPAMSTPAAIVIRGAALDSGWPVVFGDGLRCVGVPLVRLAATFAGAGTSTHTFGHGAMAGSGTFYYQLWFRNTPIMFCDPAAAFNLSGGRTLDW